jgi:FKBP-type peptidyl-prolyl cis-trans isomerase FkpA
MTGRIARGVAAAVLLAGPAFAQDPGAEAPISAEAQAAGLTSPETRTAYAIGLQVGRSIKDAPFALDMEKLQQGIEDAMADKQPSLTPMEVQEILMNFRQVSMAAAQERKMKQGEENLVSANAFLDENKAKEGWKVTESGLQYRVVKEGEGASPKESDTVKVHYRGTLTDGTLFDSSYDRGQPATFGLNQVISGWTEGLQLMKPGAKFQFAIPPDLGYGVNGPNTIPPNSVLLFDVELLEIVGADGDGSITIEPGN